METFKMRTKVPEPVALDFSDPLVPDLALGFDENHQVVIVDRGMKDLQAHIDAAGAHCPSLAELCKGVPGRTPLEQLSNAIDAGLLPATQVSDQVVDLTDLPTSIGDLANTGRAAQKVLGSQKDIATLVDELVKARLAEQEAKKEAAAQAEKGETK